jgi:hypothetical protein
MGGGFVHEEEIGWIKEQFHKGQAGFLPTAENPHGFKDVVPTKEKRTENRPSGLFIDGIRRIENRFENLMFHVQCVAPVLREVTHPDIVTQ